MNRRTRLAECGFILQELVWSLSKAALWFFKTTIKTISARSTRLQRMYEKDIGIDWVRGEDTTLVL